MDLDKLTQFIDREDARLYKYYQSHLDQEKMIYARTIKLAEEFGELCDEILSSKSIQRKEKLSDYKSEDLQEEFADVFITTLLLAKAMDVDIEDALERKIIKIDARYESRVS